MTCWWVTLKLDIRCLLLIQLLAWNAWLVVWSNITEPFDHLDDERKKETIWRCLTTIHEEPLAVVPKSRNHHHRSQIRPTCAWFGQFPRLWYGYFGTSRFLLKLFEALKQFLVYIFCPLLMTNCRHLPGIIFYLHFLLLLYDFYLRTRFCKLILAFTR